ncbi:zinc dependent phospholipase C family protein [Vibrio salinus]|uniref:zinc dependent phospholipase C family protein n=1 Tax=Vibrio salinus TaxID=2899784 RepID=UPI001E4C178A|nr:zinc dependent phospholipase C family protein [Vibrio salinus]MCE0495586.1 zinc dependent phospholipase C family protein [Vibrio salinus]
MPGAFAHITAINLALSSDFLDDLSELPTHAKRNLVSNLPFAELGSISPDYPYLSIGMDQRNWADLMHSERVGVLVRSLIFRVKMLPDSQKEKGFAWLVGFVSHVIMDITVHPVVERRVGPYKENKQEHRICEMNQDTYIWSRLGLDQAELSERLKKNISLCSDQRVCDLLDDTIRSLWSIALTEVYSGYANACLPKINQWHASYLSIVNIPKESHDLFPLSRHIGISQGLIYPGENELDYSYINSLDTPLGKMAYDDVFDRAVSFIRYYLIKLWYAVFDGGDDQMFCNWNLDTGYNLERRELTAWVTTPGA